MTDLCAQCSESHLYKTYAMVGGFPLWFCGPRCRNVWMVHDKPASGKKLHLLVLAALIFTGVTFKAWGAPPDMDSPLPYAAWFESVHNKEGTWCCTVADGHMTDYTYDGENYKVKLDGQFYLIPWNSPIIAIRHDKPFIGEVIWYYHNSDGSITVRCFVADDAT